MASKLYIGIKFFRALLPYLPTTHIKQVKLMEWKINDASVNIIRGILANVVCDEFFIDVPRLRTRQVANMLVNVKTVANVLLVNSSKVNVDKLSNLYPGITFSRG